MDSGTVSAEDFVKLATEFVRFSAAVGDNWHLECIQLAGKSENVQFLTKKATHLLKLENDVQVEQEDCEIEENSSIVPFDNEHSLTPCNFDYHIIHSCSYSVPVLYFNAYKPDGQLLSLEELWNCIPEEHKHLTEEKWSFVTQQEHPFLHRPFFQLHPCHTSDLMKIFHHSKSDASLDNYLITWLSSVGPVVHLNLPLNYANRKICDSNVRLEPDSS